MNTFWLYEDASGMRVTSRSDAKNCVPLKQTDDLCRAVAAQFVWKSGGGFVSTDFKAIARYATYAWLRYGIDGGNLIFLTTNFQENNMNTYNFYDNNFVDVTAAYSDDDSVVEWVGGSISSVAFIETTDVTETDEEQRTVFVAPLR